MPFGLSEDSGSMPSPWHLSDVTTYFGGALRWDPGRTGLAHTKAVLGHCGHGSPFHPAEAVAMRDSGYVAGVAYDAQVRISKFEPDYLVDYAGEHTGLRNQRYRMRHWRATLSCTLPKRG